MTKSSRRTRAGWWAVALAGVLTAVLVPWGWSSAHHPRGADRGFDEHVPVSTSPLSASSSPAAPARTSTSNPVAAPSSPFPATSVSLRINAIAVVADVRAVGVDAAGAMDIPQRVDTVGWYRWSPLPGTATGTVVLAGHVDSSTQGLGALYRLREVQAQAVIVITGVDGRQWHYRVVARRQYAKTSVPLAALFTLTGPPRLVIITCGGAFDPAARSYEDNIVVTAEPQ